ncbi:MAG: ABC transporter ATP-binding protein [Eubacteriales bacterium]|nr:ABC transporter ATP-binding protein [Eubacteriales bacterium]
MSKVKQKLRRGGVSIMVQLISLLGSFSIVLLLAVLNGSIGYLCAMGVTLSGALGVAKVLGEQISLSYGGIIALAVGCGILRGLLRYIEQYSNHYIAFHLLASLRDKIFRVLRKLCPAKLESKQKGSIIAMLTSDIETLEVFYAHTLSPICIAVLVSLSVFLFIFFGVNPYLALTALLGYLTVGIAVPVISSGALQEAGVNYRREFASFHSYFLDSIKGIYDILFHNAGEKREKEVNRRSEILLKETKKMKDASAKAAAVTELIVTVFIVLSLVVGIALMRTGQLSAGKMIIGVVAVFGSFGPVIAISALPGNLTQTLASGDRVLNLMEEQPAVEEIRNGSSIVYEQLDVKNLSFSYKKNEPVLKNICMHADKGEIIGIVGESGCGKSTLLKLLLRFWTKNSGEINYNGMDIETINSDSLLDNVTMVSQTTYLFDDTIEENLRIAKPDAIQEELERACRMASVHDFIMTLPDGYRTRVGALGNHLSAGEKQRIGLARAFLSGRELILLDEPTSNVDSINEGIILKALAEQKSRKSIILVSHRESTMAIADRVYKVENGLLSEINTN